MRVRHYVGHDEGNTDALGCFYDEVVRGVPFSFDYAPWNGIFQLDFRTRHIPLLY